MSVIDPIGDMLTRIRNASNARRFHGKLGWCSGALATGQLQLAAAQLAGRAI